MLSNCTFANNVTGRGGIDEDFCYEQEGPRGKGGALHVGGQTVVTDSIIWGNSPDQVYGVDCNNVSFCDIGGGECLGGVGNISVDPFFVQPGYWAHVEDPNITVEPNDPNAVWVHGDYHLSQVAAGQAVDSPCLDAGSDLAVNLGLDKFTTRTDKVGDEGIVDMGYHYSETVADLNEDGTVDTADLGILASQWRGVPQAPSADIAPANSDGTVDEGDLAILASYWLWPW
jgi:hypothetical protein